MAGGEARVSDADREHAVAGLREAHVEGRLTLEEFAERAGLAYGARTSDELARVGEGLPAAPASRKRPRRVAAAVLSGRTLIGRWRPGRTLVALSLFGGVDVDLRDVTLEPGGLTIYMLALFGGNDVYVPEGIEVDMRGFAVLGSGDEHGDEGSIDLGSPPIRVQAYALFGSNDVRHVARATTGSIRELKLERLRDVLHGRALS